MTDSRNSSESIEARIACLIIQARVLALELPEVANETRMELIEALCVAEVALLRWQMEVEIDPS